ncbi:MAG: DUF4369 domain-containing protein [Mediterranea massiliensis]|nr:DUF4369 domain-containing protein [Mediterranea massiliensis]
MKQPFKVFLFIAAFILSVFSSCSSLYHIEGNSSITTLDGRMLYLKTIRGNEWLPVDSTEVLHGSFKMEGPVDSARIVTLYMDEESIMPLVLEDGDIEIVISNSQLLAKGTPLNDALYGFIEHHNQLENRLIDLERKEARMVLEGANIDEVREQLSKEAEVITKEKSDYIKGFISDNIDNVLGPTVFMMLCNSMPYPMMTPWVEDVMRIAPTTFKENPQIKEFLEAAKENKQLIEENQRLQENVILKSKTKR